METTDGRYVKILEIEPINFMLRSSEEQYNILSSFASWLKISPMKLQFKSITRKADSDKHIAMIRKELSIEDNAQCKAMGEDYIRLIKDVGSREALTRRFFLIYQYEAIGRSESDDYSKIYSMLVSAEQNARAYFMQCGNNIIQPQNPDQAVAEILYMFFNRRSCVDEPFTDRVNRVIIDTMAAKGKIIGIDPIPHISVRHFIAPRGLDLSHYNYIVMDGRYYCFLYIKGNGYPSTVRGGWMSSLINAGEGIDIDVHLSRENRSKTIDKVAQRIRLNRTKLKGMQDTSTDYEELTNSIQAVRTDNGYTLLKDNIKIVISQVEATELCDIYSSDLLGLVQNDPRYAAIIKGTGNLKNMPQPHLEHHLLTASATVDSKDVNMLDDDGSANAIVPLKVINTRGFDLPQTGDSGTMAFSIIGILLMACAAVVIVMVFRKKCNSN